MTISLPMLLSQQENIQYTLMVRRPRHTTDTSINWKLLPTDLKPLRSTDSTTTTPRPFYNRLILQKTENICVWVRVRTPENMLICFMMRPQYASWGRNINSLLLLLQESQWHTASVTSDLLLPSQPNSTANVPRPVLISHPTEGRRLSWPGWLVTYQDNMPANSHPPQY